MSRRLASKLLGDVPAAVAVPGYNRESIGAGIVHLGVGAFHRAHQAWYTDRALCLQPGNWGIIGASLRSSAVAEQLDPQDGLYTLVEREGDERRYRIVGALKSLVVAPQAPDRLIGLLADQAIRVVTLTITEKGYCYSAARQGLAMDDPAVREDMENYPCQPRTAIGYLAAGLAARRKAAAGGLTLLSCDNLPHNGRVLAAVLRDFIAEAEPSLWSWVEENVTFPCSMVDRIVPASTEADLATLSEELGYEDRGAIFTEPFSQWVIENNFARGAPDWASVGALYTDDVSPFETMKLRLLNGSHSLMAYLGYLAGYEYVHQVMADAELSRLVRDFMDTQAQPTLRVPEGFDIEEYKDQLCRRFANAALNHRLFQIAQDGSQKIPQRWLASLRDLLTMERDTTPLALAVAGWLRFLCGRRDNGEAFAVDDPLAEQLRVQIQEGGHPAAVLELEVVFGDLARTQPAFVVRVKSLYDAMASSGVKHAVVDRN